MNTFVKLLTSDRTAAGSVGFLAILVAVAVFAPLLAPYAPDSQDLASAKVPPCRAHLFGTDFQGSDVLSKMIYGSRQAVLITMGVGVVTVCFGFIIGLVAGYGGGWLDAGLMRAVDIVLAFPSLLLNIVLFAALGPGFGSLFLALTLSGWAPVARVTRALVLSLANAPYVTGARALGATARRIVVCHIVPGCMSTITVVFAMRAASALLAVSALNYLGLGDPRDTNAWGTMVNLGQFDIVTAWWWPLFPASAIALTVMAVNLLADALRDHLDPRMKVRAE